MRNFLERFLFSIILKQQHLEINTRITLRCQLSGSFLCELLSYFMIAIDTYIHEDRVNIPSVSRDFLKLSSTHRSRIVSTK